MKPEKLEQALEHIRDDQIMEAAAPKKRHFFRWAGAVAAVLAIALLAGTLGGPLAPKSENTGYSAEAAPGDMVLADKVTNLLDPLLLVSASAARIEPVPDYEKLSDAQFDQAVAKWRQDLDARDALKDDALAGMMPFLTDSCKIFLQNSNGANRVWSPVNGYIALAMLAEATAGTSRLEALDLLGCKDLEQLREQVSAVWESTYCNEDEKEICRLASSLWLDDQVSYHDQALKNLAFYHYADIYRGNFGTPQTDQAIQNWINEKTGKLLKEYTAGITLPDLTVLTLISTVYLQSKWQYDTEFQKENNTDGIFHSPSGDVECTFMNHKLFQTSYHWGDSYGAISLPLTNGCSMWLILPDEDKTVDTVLEEGQYLQTVTKDFVEDDPNRQYSKVNIALPKFDVAQSADLKDGFQEMGLIKVFSPELADFSASIVSTDSLASPVYLSAVQQAARVVVDEEGVTAASYIMMPAAGAAAPPDEIVDFILDRPFLFVIEKNNLPLFTGIVNTP